MRLAVLGLLLSLTGPALADEPRLLDNVRQLTFEGKLAGEGYFSADGTRMIFQSERNSDNPFYQIYLMDLETGDVEQLSPGVGRTTCAWIHPTENRVLYSSTHEDPQARRKMYKEIEERSSGKARRYSWSYDFTYEIYTQDLDTGNRTNLTNVIGYDAEGSYSPDGQWIAFASNRRAYTNEMTPEEKKAFEHYPASMMDLYLMRADGSDVQRLTTALGYDGGPFFSADGRYLTWRRFAENGATAEIFTMDLATRTEKKITRMGHMSWAPYFHPSGDYVIFASNVEGYANFELFIVDAAGTKEPVRVTFTHGFDGLPVFAPDGKKLSWTSKRSSDKTSQIFLADWNDAAARQLLGLDGASSAPAAKADIAATGAAISAADARLHVERLTADEMEGRLTGSPGAQKTTNYVALVFAQLGLEPAGDGGSFFQAFPFTKGVDLGSDNSLTVTIDGKPLPADLNTDWRPLAFLRTGGITAAGAVFAGYGIVAPASGEVPAYDSYDELEVKGKWVVVLRFQPENVPPAWRRHWIRYSDLPYKASLAKQRGALGLIVVTGPNSAARSRLVALDGETGAGGSLAGLSLGDALAGKLIGQDLSTIQDKLDKGEAVTGFALDGVRIAAQIDIAKQRGEGRNVLARLRTGAPENAPVVMLGAHVDHLGRGSGSGSLARDDERGAIHPGADDNASGVAGLLEAAQYLADLQARGKLGARRDIVFAAWSGEELGTLGSSHFVEQAGEVSKRVAAYLNMDMIGRLRDKVFLQGTDSSPAWTREIERRNVPVGLPIALQGDPYLPTDTTPFYLRGVPVLNGFTGAHEDYSTPRDSADKLDYDGLRDVARLFAGLTRGLARAETAPEHKQVVRKKGGVGRKHLRAYLGTISAYGQDDSIKGVKLQGAVKGALAMQAGVQPGDILVGLAGIEVETIHDFMNALAGLKAGEATEMWVMRQGARVKLTVVPGARE